MAISDYGVLVNINGKKIDTGIYINPNLTSELLNLKLKVKKITEFKSIIMHNVEMYNLHHELFLKLDKLGKTKKDVSSISTELFVENNSSIIKLEDFEKIYGEYGKPFDKKYYVFLKDGRILTNNLEIKNEIWELL